MKRRENMIGFSNLERLKEEGIESLFPFKTKILVGMATCGQAAGAGEVWQALDKEVKKRKIDVLLKKHREIYRRFYLRPKIMGRYLASFFSRSGARRALSIFQSLPFLFKKDPSLRGDYVVRRKDISRCNPGI